jgi:DNA-binding response OmpR family regulator
VAEDDDLVLDLVCHVLRDSGYEVVCSRDPRECIEKLQRYDGPIDLLVTDVVMPGMGGRELHRRLSETRPGMRVLCMSGYSEEVIAVHGVDADCTQVLYKPFSVHALLAQVREVLDR